MKTLFIIRHAKPELFAEGGDRERRLTVEGEEIHRRICETLKGRGYTLDQIFASPLVRAQETAAITASILPAPIQVQEALGDRFDAEPLLRDLNETSAATVAWVGHEPTLSHMVNTLVGERVLLAGLATSGVAVISFEGPVAYGQGVLLEYIHPGNVSLDHF